MYKIFLDLTGDGASAKTGCSNVETACLVEQEVCGMSLDACVFVHLVVIKLVPHLFVWRLTVSCVVAPVHGSIVVRHTVQVIFEVPVCGRQTPDMGGGNNNKYNDDDSNNNNNNH